MTDSTGPDAEHDRRVRRLIRITSDILTDTCHVTSPAMSADEQATAEAWLWTHGFDHLWRQGDVVAAAARRVRGWFEDALLIADCHPRRSWTCLATATSDLGDRASTGTSSTAAARSRRTVGAEGKSCAAA